MTKNYTVRNFSEVFDINPKTILEKNTEIDFVEMKDIKINSRAVTSKYKKKFKGAGTKFQKGDTLFARITPCLENGKISQYNGNDVAFGSTEFIILRGKKEITTNDFTFYYAKWEKFRKFAIKNMTGTSGRQRVPVQIFDKWKVIVPPIEHQKIISFYLRQLDNKIELNERINQNLEKIINKLFKSWFINFDPVKSKEAGESIGLSKEISDLFTDSFNDSFFGKIPQSWKISKFGELFIPKRGKVITKKMITPGEIPVVAGGINPAYYHSKSNATSPVVTISASGNAGYVNLFYKDIWASDCSYINKDVTDFIYFSYSFLKINQNKIFHLKHGAVQQHINPKDLMGLDIVLPPISLISKYEQIVTPLHNKISNNLNEINTLSSLRDLLLPKLISGELKIADSQKLIDEVSV